MKRTVIDLLAAAAVEDLERAQGEWHDGEWADFDPLSPRTRFASKIAVRQA
jgi:hypothetical protein